MSIVNGYVAFTNGSGQTTVSDYTISNFASGGIPSISNAGAGVDIAMTLSTYQTAGLAPKLASAAVIDATDATSAQINAFIASHTNAAPGSLIEASVTAAQFSSLGALLGGAIAVDATGATAAQIDAMAASVVIAAGAISNATFTYAQFASIASPLYADKGVSVDASGVAAGLGAGTAEDVIDDTVAAAAQVLQVSNLAIDADNVNQANFSSFVALAPLGITSVDATAFTATEWTLLIAARTAVARGAIDGTLNLSIANFVTIPNKFADGGATEVDFTNATSDQIAAAITSILKLAQNAVVSATLTPTEFSALVTKIATGEATVDAATATSAEVTTILQNLGAFNNSLSNLSLSADQFDSVVVADLNTAVTTGTLLVTATSAATIDASGMAKAISIVGSTGADVITLGAGSVQGGKGSDSITGSAGDDSLNGGNAADTIIGGAGDDTITGGNSIAQQYFTGGADNDTFVMNGGNNVIVDLGGSAGGDADVLINAAVVSDTITTVANNIVDWAADIAGDSSNNGSLTLNAKSTVNAVIDATFLAGLVGVSINGGNGDDTLTGGDNSDSIVGGAGADEISGLAGTNTLTGGTGTDLFNVDGTDTITDLSGADDVAIALDATANATVTADWIAGVATENSGTAVVTIGNGFDVDVANAGGAEGWTLTAEGNTSASIITGSVNADTITGGNGADYITGGDGIDVIDLGADTAIDIVNMQGIVSALNADEISNFVGGASGDVIEVLAADFVYDNGDGSVFITAAVASTLGVAAMDNTGGAVGVNYILVDTAANIEAADLSTQYAGGALAYATDTGELFFDADGDFSAAAEIIGTVTATGTMTTANFLIA